MKTSELGDFFRPLLPGKYRMEISKSGHLDFHDQIEVPESGSLQMNFTLQRYQRNRPGRPVRTGHVRDFSYPYLVSKMKIWNTLRPHQVSQIVIVIVMILI